MGGGLFTNVGPKANFVVHSMGLISPVRYSTEHLLRILLKDKEYLTYMCDFFDYTYKQWCLPNVAAVALVFFLYSGMTYLMKAKFL